MLITGPDPSDADKPSNRYFLGRDGTETELTLGQFRETRIHMGAKYIITRADAEHYLKINTPLEEIPEQIREYVSEWGGRRSFGKEVGVLKTLQL
jgi:hypothetical protein